MITHQNYLILMSSTHNPIVYFVESQLSCYGNNAQATRRDIIKTIWPTQVSVIFKEKDVTNGKYSVLATRVSSCKRV